MRNFKQCVIIMTIVFIAVLAVLEVDHRCADMYSEGGRIAEEAVNAVIATKELWHD